MSAETIHKNMESKYTFQCVNFLVESDSMEYLI